MKKSDNFLSDFLFFVGVVALLLNKHQLDIIWRCIHKHPPSPLQRGSLYTNIIIA
ncbi:hypothetical protein HMPREF9074_08068 [Capnocytophaga sp. oral taxon 329 str. F0087]|nr:hypothetical protein HMPREF9074_08068 [Capnocytophaga sp. oral taxon 329 str. F0087]